MYLLNCKLSITGQLGVLFFEFVNDIEVKSAWRSLTDTCVLKLPRKIQNYKGQKLDEVIRRGDAVNVQVGYDRQYRDVFNGFVLAVKPTWPIEIFCDDAMFTLKQLQVEPKSFKDATLQQIVNYCGIPQAVPVAPLLETEIGPFKITLDTNTAAKVLNKLKEKYFLYSFFRNGQLHIGDPYPLTAQVPVVFGFGQNIIKNDLVYRRKEDILLKVKATSYQLNGKRIVLNVGDSKGEVHCLEYFNLNKTQLETIARRDLERLQYTGYRGKFTAFGEPAIQHGQVAQIIDTDNPENSGNYFVDAVDTGFGMNGFRQEIALGPKSA